VRRFAIGMLKPDADAGAQRNLAETLRELRRASGLSGERLAARCAMSQAKISRIETGKVLPTVIDVEQIVRALGVPPPVADQLLVLARAANVDYASWRAYARLGIWRKQDEIKKLSDSARRIRQFLPAIPTGLLQTAGFARAALRPKVDSEPVYDVERAVRARLDSQRVLEDPQCRFEFVLTEQAVRCHLAEAAVMREQLRHMADVAAWSNIDLAILTNSVPMPEAPLNLFVVYDERLVTVELFSGEVVLRDPRDVAYHLELFELFQSHALREGDAVQFLRAIAEELM
jgi:transcriptional regulator with XRE-family HTH domain